MFFRLFCALSALLLLALPAAAECRGRNLLADLSPTEDRALEAAVAEQPHAEGNLWRATRGDSVLHLVGTYHLDDPRHDAAMATLRPLLDAATTLLVEAGPDEEQALRRAMAERPELMYLTEGPSLMQRLPPADWDALAAAMEARGMPAFMAAKLQPWYVSLMLGVPACGLAEAMQANGLDHRLMDAAAAAGVPVRALEPYDTLFGLFASLSESEQIEMIRTALLMEDRAADHAVTLSDLYFAEDSRRMWELLRLQARDMPGYTREKADAEFARMEELLMSRRNRAWLPVIEAAAAQGPTIAAFGALHLSGHEGVLALLEGAGWQLERVAF